MDSKGYELPSLDNISTPQEAGEAINKVYADAMADSGHPWVSGNHIQHRDFLARVAELQEIKMQGSDMRTDLDKALQKAVDHTDEQQTARVEEAEGIMAELVEQGYRKDKIPGDVCRYEVDLLRLQLQAARGEYDEVILKIENDLRRLGAPVGMHDTLKALRSVPGHLGDYKQQLAEGLLFWIRDQKRAKYGRVDIF